MKIKYNILILLVLSFAYSTCFSQDIPELKSRVNDYAGMLNQTEKNNLESLLQQIEKSTTAQLVLLTVNSLDGIPIEDYSIKVAEKWKIGTKQDNGLIVIVAKNDRKIRIEVGYGLEPIIPDGRAGTIIRTVITPEFKSGNYYNGFYRAFEVMGNLISGKGDSEFAKIEAEPQVAKDEDSGLSGVVIFFIIIIVIIMVIPKKKNSGKRGGGDFPGFFFFGGGGGGSSSGFFSGGGGGFSGFSGGGGSFGGGGASGSW